MERIDDLLRDYIKSVNTCDINLARDIWDREGSVSLIYPNGYAFSFEEIRDKFYTEILDGVYSKRDFKIKDIMTRFYGTTALLEFYWDFYGVLKNKDEEIHIEGIETQFVVLRDAGWKISNIHSSIK